MDQSELSKWVDDYIQAQELGVADIDHPLWWSVAKFFDLVQSDPEACWQAVLEIVRRNPSQRVLSVLSAGPLEDLIDDHGARFIDRIEMEAQRNPLFKGMLKNVWRSGSDDVWTRVERAAGLP